MTEEEKLEERREKVRKVKEAIEEKKRKLKNELGERFDSSKFDHITQDKDIEEIKQVKAEDVTKENGNGGGNSSYNAGGGKHYTAKRNSDGTCSAVDENGNVINAKNIEELSDKICESFKRSAEKEGKECKAGIHSNDNKAIEAFCKSAIKTGVTISPNSDMPKNKEFWDNLKSSYLLGGNHSLEEWNKMTRFVPDSAMGRTAEQSAENKNLIDRMKAEEKARTSYKREAEKLNKRKSTTKENSNTEKKENSDQKVNPAYMKYAKDKQRGM